MLLTERFITDGFLLSIFTMKSHSASQIMKILVKPRKCCELRDLTQTFPELLRRVTSVQFSKDGIVDRYRQLDIINGDLAKVRRKLQIVRDTLRVLYVLPPLLIAKGIITSQGWEDIHDIQQRDENNTVIVTQKEAVERIFDNHFPCIDEMGATSRREALMNEINVWGKKAVFGKRNVDDVKKCR
ncbi:hypothetical protein OESDEN_06566 [Oesophagostomum dentatum]|uniref:Uncharacterized protein n=1 Tax=Oesophagostomum dentatum TaxID=61180 RepID=A0A0B1TCG0_OESDE|nr:hypothetical protein OESDEN_06566 [Oesophagostomum dentatum]